MYHGPNGSSAGRKLAAVMLLAACAFPAGALAAEEDPNASAEQRQAEGVATWRFVWDNDAVQSSDNQYSNGWSLQVHGRPSKSWEQVRGTPAFGNAVARWFLPDRRDGLYFREGWAVGQLIQTPEDIEREDLIEDDVPYAGVLAVQNTWVAYDDRQLYGFGWLMGVVGPSAKGEEVQKWFHEVINDDEPMGWEHQLDDELLVNFYYEMKRKLVGSSSGDISWVMDARLGNLVTAAAMGMEGRLGWHVPRGFLYVPDPIGWRLSYDSHLPPQEPTNWTFYGSLAAGVTALGHTAVYDGNLDGDSHSIDHENLIGAVALGLHYQRRRWGIHLDLVLTSDMVDPDVASSQSDTTDDFGSLMFEFRH
jgi:hypothetical protein